jgi:hypothetical protein
MTQPAHQTHNTEPERNDVNDTLTAASRTRGTAGKTPARRGTTRRRRRAEVENTDYAAFASRVIRAHARRISEGDVDGLADLLALRDELDTATQVAVTGLRSFGYSWNEIASRLGTTRQAAQQRWGK